MNNNLKKCIDWMMTETKIKIDKIPNKTFLSDKVMETLKILESELLFLEEFYDLVRIKNEVRKLYRHVNSYYSYSSWQAPGAFGKKEISLSGYSQNGINKYYRVHNSSILLDVKKSFEEEFYNYEESSLSFITNSGMSSLEMGAMICNYFHGDGSVLIQNEQYYEIEYLTKAYFVEFEVCSIKEICEKLLSDEIIHCVVAGYAPHSNKDNMLDLDYFLNCISQHKQKQNIIVIIDRTFFSIIDDYKKKLNHYKFDKGVIFVSCESLNKNHQYGMDCANLGYCRIDSRSNRLISSFGFLDKIYSVGTMRPEICALGNLFKFNKELLVERYMIMCRNAEILTNDILKAGYELLNMSCNTSVSNNQSFLGNVIFIVLNINFESNEGKLMNLLKSQDSLVVGTSFGFDITRAEFISIGLEKTLLRISVGIEPEPIISKIKIVIINILSRIRGIT